MPRKAAQVPGKAPVAAPPDTIPTTPPPAVEPPAPGTAPETPAAKAQTAGRVNDAAVNEVLAAEANPVKPGKAIDPTTLRRSVYIEGEGWLCPQAPQSTNAQR